MGGQEVVLSTLEEGERSICKIVKIYTDNNQEMEKEEDVGSVSSRRKLVNLM